MSPARRPDPGPARIIRAVIVRLLAFVLPLGLDSFAVAAALGAAQPLGRAARLRISLIFVAFEAGMPLIGLGAGGGLARLVGGTADYVAAAAVIGIGVWMLADRDEDEIDGARRLVGASGLAVIALGVSISLDELAIGFSLGLTRLPAVPVIIAIGGQALVASQLGLALGGIVGERFRERAGRIAGVALILLGGYLIAEQATR
jgi:manganese efflux pump family protein